VAGGGSGFSEQSAAAQAGAAAAARATAAAQVGRCLWLIPYLIHGLCQKPNRYPESDP